MELVLNLLDRCFRSQDSVLHVGGKSISFLAERYGTPLFVYDRSVLDKKLDILRAALPQFEIYYSVKANPNLAILRHFVLRGCGLEVASGGEFLQALASGCRPESIVMAGTGKTDFDLRLVISRNIGEIHIESVRELTRIASIWAHSGIPVRVGIRVNPTAEAQGGAIRMGGRPGPFGIDEEALDSVVDLITSTPGLDFRSIHMFAGTQVLDCAVLLRQFRKCIRIAGSVVSRIGRPLYAIDFGGGFGIPYFPGEQDLDFECLAEAARTLMNEVQGDPCFLGTRFMIEPGRFLVGESGIYITRIIDIKESRGKKFVIVDGGMNHHLAASGHLGQILKRNYPVALVEKLHQKPEEQVDVVGPLSTPLDTIGRNLLLPRAEVGDLVGIFQSGAYARSASPLGFLSYDAPAEVLVDSGEDFLIRSRGTTEDFMRDVSIPSCMLAVNGA